MARRKNKKRIDPRYFLHETAYRDDIKEGTVPHSAQHVVEKMKETGLSAKKALKSLTTDLSDEEAERWLERHKDEMDSDKEEIEEAQGIPSPEYHNDASKIGRWGGPFSDEKPEKTQGPALPPETQIVADFVNKKIPGWLKHVEEMKENIKDPDNYMVKGSPGIKQLQRPMEEFLHTVKNLQKNLQQDKPIRRQAMGQPFGNDYVEMPSKEEHKAVHYAYSELAEAFSAAARYVGTLNYAGSTEKQKRINKLPNYAEIAKHVLGVLRPLIGGRDMSSWSGAYKEKNPETGYHGGPVKYSPEKDAYPARYPRYIGENLKKIIDEEIEAVLNDGYGET